jgi:hypothetical protein
MIDEFGRQTISRELEQSCADEAIRIIGTVQPHGFVLVAEVRTARILQVSSGIARHWPAVGEPARLLGARLSDWVDGLGGDPSGVLSALPATARRRSLGVRMCRPPHGRRRRPRMAAARRRGDSGRG